jgi:hypothetical protein
METTPFKASVAYMNTGIGVKLAPEEMVRVLDRMQLPAKYNAAANVFPFFPFHCYMDMNPISDMSNIAIGSIGPMYSS